MTSSLALLAAAADGEVTLESLVNSPATVATVIAAAVLIGFVWLARSIYHVAMAIREYADVVKKANTPDIEPVVKEVLNRVGGHIEEAVATARQHAATTVAGVLDDVGQLYENDDALKSGIQAVAKQANVETPPMRIAGNDWRTYENVDPPVGATWAPQSDIDAARKAAIHGDATKLADANRQYHAHTGTGLPPGTPELPFDPQNYDTVMDYVVRLCIQVHSMYPWNTIDDTGYEPGTLYYDLLQPTVEQDFHVIIPKTFEELRDGLSRDAEMKFKPLGMR